MVKVVSRVRNAKNRFRALSRGAVTGERMGGLLSKLKEAKNQEEITKEKKKVIQKLEQKLGELQEISHVIDDIAESYNKEVE